MLDRVPSGAAHVAEVIVASAAELVETLGAMRGECETHEFHPVPASSTLWTLDD